MPSIKQKKDAPQSFIQHFIGPSCTAPGLWIGIWRWLDNQKIPSSDKWGFFSVCEKAEGVCFPQGLWNTERNWAEGPRVFPYGAWDKEWRTPLLPTLLTDRHAKYIRHTFRPTFIQVSSSFKKHHIQTYWNKASEVGCRAACRPQLRQSTEEAATGTWKRSVMWSWHDKLHMRQTLSIYRTPAWHKNILKITFSHTNRPRSGQMPNWQISFKPVCLS